MQWRSLLSAMLIGTTLTGCYELTPVDRASVPAGLDVAVDLNDQGRANLGSQIGPEVATLTGTLVQRENDALVLAVTELKTLRGATQVWKGERVTVKPEYISTAYQRQYSKTRTFLLAGATLAAGAFIGTRTLGGGGTEDPVTPPTNGQTLRIP